MFEAIPIVALVVIFLGLPGLIIAGILGGRALKLRERELAIEQKRLEVEQEKLKIISLEAENKTLDRYIDE